MDTLARPSPHPAAMIEHHPGKTRRAPFMDHATRHRDHVRPSGDNPPGSQSPGRTGSPHRTGTPHTPRPAPGEPSARIAHRSRRHALTGRAGRHSNKATRPALTRHFIGSIFKLRHPANSQIIRNMDKVSSPPGRRVYFALFFGHYKPRFHSRYRRPKPHCRII